MAEINIEFDEDLILKPYKNLLNSDASINLLWGGRDSGKSYFIAQKLILECLTSKYFRCILIKKTFESIKDSQWQLIKDIVNDWNLDHLFSFKMQPLEIHCTNGNKFIARGCDDAQKLKSISNPSHAWYEEGNQLDEADYIIATTTLRNNKGDVKEWFSFNPECEGDFKDFWLYKMFFSNHVEKNEYTFEDNKPFIMPDGSVYYRQINSTHTTYKDNVEFCAPSRIAIHESFKTINPYYYKVFTLGLWGKRLGGGEIMKCFKYDKHVGKTKYNANLALHISFDENVNPYLPCAIFQVEDKNIYLIDEIIGYHPNNKVVWSCNEIKRKYYNHKEAMYIYGDPASQKDDVKLQDGEDLFQIIITELYIFKPERRVLNSHPAVRTSIDFFNTILELNFNGLIFSVNEDCKISVKDYENAKENENGKIDKKTVKDKETNKTYQPYGHIIDATRYFLCYLFAKDYSLYQYGNKPSSYKVTNYNYEEESNRY